MNIIYLLTNKSKTSGARYYIGSKVECNIISLNNISTIVDNKSNQPYYSSSQNIEFKKDFENKDVFEASILEEVSDRSKILERENYYISKFNAVSSSDYYNLAQATLGGVTMNFNSYKNIYLETIKSYAANQSQSSKKKSTAKTLGFENICTLAYSIYDRNLEGETFAAISRSLGRDRHFAQKYIKDFNIQQHRKEILDTSLKAKVRLYLDNGASLKMIAQLLKIDELTVYYFDDQYSTSDKNFKVARQKGLTDTELSLIVSKDLVLNNKTVTEVCKEHGMTRLQVQRYFMRFIQNKLKASDFE